MAEIGKHHPIKIGSRDNCCLFMTNSFCKCLPICCWRKKPLWKKVMNHSEEMITEHFDILNIIKDLRDLKVLITN